MDAEATLRERIAHAIEGASFYPQADIFTRYPDWIGGVNFQFVGHCFEFSSIAEQKLRESGLEVLPLCTLSVEGLPVHAFLKIRDPENGATLYYDPTAEQFGVTGAHRRAFTRQEVEAFNQEHMQHWLEHPVLFFGGALDDSWRHREAELEALRAKWGEEIYGALPYQQRIQRRGDSYGIAL